MSNTDYLAAGIILLLVVVIARVLRSQTFWMRRADHFEGQLRACDKEKQQHIQSLTSVARKHSEYTKQVELALFGDIKSRKIDAIVHALHELKHAATQNYRAISSFTLARELELWLDQQEISGDTIRKVRRLCFLPWDSQWNAIVRDKTAERETSQNANPTLDPRPSNSTQGVPGAQSEPDSNPCCTPPETGSEGYERSGSEGIRGSSRGVGSNGGGATY